MCICHPLNICDVWKNSVYSHHTSPILSSISTYPLGVDLALRTDWCVWLPWIIVDPCKYFRSFHMCIYHLHNVFDMWKKFSLFPTYLPILTSISTHPCEDLALRTDWCAWLPCIIVDPRKYSRSFHMCIYHLHNVCDVWNNSVCFHHTSPILTSISTCPRGVDLAMRTD